MANQCILSSTLLPNEREEDRGMKMWAVLYLREIVIIWTYSFVIYEDQCFAITANKHLGNLFMLRGCEMWSIGLRPWRKDLKYWDAIVNRNYVQSYIHSTFFNCIKLVMDAVAVVVVGWMWVLTGQLNMNCSYWLDNNVYWTSLAFIKKILRFSGSSDQRSWYMKRKCWPK